MNDLETLRRHEQSLRGLLRSQPNHTRDPFVEALQWSLARVREDIAKAEFCPRCINGRLGKYPCHHCNGTGKQ